MSNSQTKNEWSETDALWRIRMAAEQETEALQERRFFERRNVQWAARIILPEGAFACTVYDLSLGGARVRLVAQLQKNQRVRLDLEKIATLNAEVVWLGIGMVGIHFIDDPAYIGRTLGPLMTQTGPAS